MASWDAAVAALEAGDVPALQALLAAEPSLATATGRGGRTLLLVLTDWPACRPRSGESVAALAAAGADVDARGRGGEGETPLMWAASSDDVAAIDALLDAGAAIDARGAVIGGGTALSDATAFGQWAAARRLVERGAAVSCFDAAALGLLELLDACTDAVDDLFWAACHGGQRAAAELLLSRGADVNAVPGWEQTSPLDAAEGAGASDLAAWLRSLGARPA